MKNLCLHNDDILEKFKKDWLLNKKYIAEKDTLFDKNLCFYSVSINRFFLSKSVSQSPVRGKNPSNTSRSFSLK